MDGDTTFTKLFVGGLAWETRRNVVRCHFEQFGEIVEAVIIADKHTGRSKGYGFVTFRDPEGAALQDPTPTIDGRKANCNLAAFGTAQRVHPVAAPFGMATLRPAMIASSLSYQGPAPAAMAASYFPQALYAYPYYYGAIMVDTAYLEHSSSNKHNCTRTARLLGRPELTKASSFR
ncbi:hypothetical protein E2562_022158 [Oryza meyeriana var. granulata]|uniref:RRM domain-containing protein n=1 Tax=Oryza meyeriana var. granulata TaxID=110450 RepID=A0A6G1DLP3_9ORYZ|nr:hypothetical protein E2562_022158 [Oryza meyeriana var. granulata]